MNVSIKPDRKLQTKVWMILLTISFFVFLTAGLLQGLLPLDEDLSGDEVAGVLWPVTAGTVLLMWIVAVPIVILWIKNLRYAIESDRIIVYKGILTKVQKNIPYRAITDFILHRSLYDRWLGIASIRVQTAGQSQTATGYEGNLAGLNDWNALHQDLRERVKALHPRSQAVAVEESRHFDDKSESPIQKQILDELKAIREVLERERR